LIGTGSAFGAAILADNMGASAEQTEAASEFGGFAGGFAAGPHAGIAGGIMQVGKLVIFIGGAAMSGWSGVGQIPHLNEGYVGPGYYKTSAGQFQYHYGPGSVRCY